tara:strand:+ start:770 stop:1381 length:612 start_codon:yes stop_codon:yes gene_type:complete
MKFQIKEKHFDSSTFFGGWYIEKNVCEELIDYFNYNKKYAVPGKTLGGINENFKKSTDLSISSGNFDNIIGLYRALLQSMLEQYIKKYPNSGLTERFNIMTDFNLQYYEPNQGFKEWHFENTGNLNSYHRHLVFMTYLNDVENAGTEFKEYPNIQNSAEQGLTLIWPAGWTHTHRGMISEKSEKYILTGWYSFEEPYKLRENK